MSIETTVPLQWTEQLSLGHAVLDAQHQHLFDLTNALMLAQDATQARGLLMKLYQHTREHFSAEEAEMARVGFPGRAAHAENHNRLLGRLGELSQAVGSGRYDRAAAVALMRDWALGHVSIDDLALRAYLHPER